MSKKAKLHEALAVEADLDGVAKVAMEEGIATFAKKPDHFMGFHKQLTLFRDYELPDTPTEDKQVVTTVQDKLTYVLSHVVRHLNVVYQKEATNQLAKADLVIDGEVLIADLPATFLLGMETKLKRWRELIICIPTHQPGIEWVADPNRGKGFFKAANDEKQFKTKKIVKPVVLYEATKEHPAQVKEAAEDITIGIYETERWTTTISPSVKSELLGRVDKLIRGCKKARQRANSTELVTEKVAKKLADFVLQGFPA